jgi:translation elongation factor EF-Ts
MSSKTRSSRSSINASVKQKEIELRKLENYLKNEKKLHELENYLKKEKKIDAKICEKILEGIVRKLIKKTLCLLLQNEIDAFEVLTYLLD